MVSLGHLFLFANLWKVICLQFCSFITENGWFSVDPANTICFKFYNKPSTWWDAKKSCEHHGLFLARPDGMSIIQFIENKRVDWTESPFWIGGINQEDRGWKWSNGDKMDFTDFDTFTGTVNKIISFFKKTTSCAMYRRNDWSIKNCDELAPYLCQSERNTILTKAEPYGRLARARFSENSTKFCEPASVQGSLELSSTGTVCFVYFEERSSWWDANKSCHEHSMSLVTVSSRSIDQRLSNIRNMQIIDFWIGAINKGNTGWKWESGKDMILTNFNTFMVTWDRMFKKTLCGAFTPFRWAKRGCDDLYPFMCQFYSISTITPSENQEVQAETTLTNSISTITPSENQEVQAETTLTNSISTITPSENQEVQAETTLTSLNSTVTPSKYAEIPEQTTSALVCADSPKAKAVKKRKQKIYKVKKVIRGRLNPKLTQPGEKTTLATDLMRCCQLCSSENGCELVNFCEKSRSCVLYSNVDSAVSGGVTSEPGCSVYVHVEKVG